MGQAGGPVTGDPSTRDPSSGDPSTDNEATGHGGRALLAPAKLTVSLQVTGVRPDGYHELDAEMVTLSLADELRMDPGAPGLTVDVEPGVRADDLPGPGQNLVERALAACDRTARVHLTKRIPLGGGLGGGSADAAAVLRWAGCADPGVAVRLGSDVPFCVIGGRARVQGVGERVTPLPFEAREFLLLLPPFGVETAHVYRAWDGDPRHEGPNALTVAALAVEPRLAAWRDALREWAGREPVLAGSGSTWFVESGGGEGTDGDGMPHELRVGAEVAPLVRARTVPAGWDGD
jgi:4-diphosphocytidyl-2-C-methyl-D-erythritol kinase